VVTLNKSVFFFIQPISMPALSIAKHPVKEIKGDLTEFFSNKLV